MNGSEEVYTQKSYEKSSVKQGGKFRANGGKNVRKKCGSKNT